MIGDCERASSDSRGRLVVDSAAEDLLRFVGGDSDGLKSGMITAEDTGLLEELDIA